MLIEEQRCRTKAVTVCKDAGRYALLEQEAIRIRLFREADLEAIKALIDHTIDVCYSGVYPPRAVEFFKRYHARDRILTRSKAGYVPVLEHGDLLIATGALVDAEICAVFVAPGVQGRGFGKRVMQALESRAALQRTHEVHLSVSLPSRRIYERLGYEIHEEAFLDVGEGQRLDYWKATKRLA